MRGEVAEGLDLVLVRVAAFFKECSEGERERNEMKANLVFQLFTTKMADVRGELAGIRVHTQADPW